MAGRRVIVGEANANAAPWLRRMGPGGSGRLRLRWRNGSRAREPMRGRTRRRSGRALASSDPLNPCHPRRFHSRISNCPWSRSEPRSGNGEWTDRSGVMMWRLAGTASSALHQYRCGLLAPRISTLVGDGRQALAPRWVCFWSKEREAETQWRARAGRCGRSGGG
ncbi:uncharacterized protein LOC112269294 [Brachypodium distachyon]|uniref:uncharacterized protein LOC112269294 n=1 Tax=Brachypodium distachyon TaxID=15368 RepID=UPI000D0CCDE2|nr:uncharacterized protein LOC112269294 [Brachypodium distachyon]|eukprot:XP_024311526.1 uncharacterized protein LOC112269294 [Brachypodium distachyon]